MKIALMITCLADALFPQVGKATVALLERLGNEVENPAHAHQQITFTPELVARESTRRA